MAKQRPAKRIAKLAPPAKKVADLGRLLPAHQTSDDRICWRFKHVDDDGPWGLAKLDATELAALLMGLRSFESMTINELFRCGGELGKCYDVASIPNPNARERLEAMRLGYMEEIYRLRLGNKPRLYGFLVRNAFHIVWWDPEHEIWPASKRHT